MVKTLLHRSKTLLATENTNILTAAMVIAGFSLLSALLGLIRNRLLASFFFSGQEGQLDVYFAAFVVPDTIFSLLITGALSAAFIPIYSKKLKTDPEQANRVMNLALNLFMAFLIAISVFIFIFALPVSRLIATFPEDQMILLSRLTRVMLVSQLFFGISGFFTSMLQSHRRFLLPAVAPVVYNLSIIFGTLFSREFGIYAPAFGVVLGAFMHMLVQFPLARKLGFRYIFAFDLNNEDILQLRHLMLPRTAALAVAQVERWVATYFSSGFSAGYLTMFSFARQLYVLPITLFGVSLGQASLPTLSSEAEDQDLSKFRRTLKDSILQIFFFALPASVLLLVLRVPVVRIVFGAKAFPWDATLLTGRTLALFTLSIAPQAATQVLVRAYYALKNTKSPLIISLLTIVIHIALSFYFARYTDFSIQGLAVAMTVANIIGFFIHLFHLEKIVGKIDILGSMLKLITATVLTGFALWIPMRLLDRYIFDTTRTVPLIILTVIAGSVGLLVYLIICKLMNIRELNAVTEIMTKINRWRINLTRTDEVIELEAQQ